MVAAAAMKIASDIATATCATSGFRKNRASSDPAAANPTVRITPNRAADPEKIAGLKPVHFLALNDQPH